MRASSLYTEALTSVVVLLQAHSFKGYNGLPGRKLQQGPPELPGELLPAVPEMIEPFAAMTPSMSAEAPMTAPGTY